MEKKLNWINFFHFHQPAYQEINIVKQISKQSYDFLIKIFKENPSFYTTINFTGALTELLIKSKQTRIIQGLKPLIQKGQIELTGTAKYHPILPLISESQIIRQIEINNKIQQANFGAAYSPKGFFCPEMSYSPKVGKIIQKMGFKWIILDQIHYNGSTKNNINYSKKYEIKGLGLKVLFRNREISKSYVPQSVEKILNQQKKYSQDFLVTATDAEMYGHAHVDNTKTFSKILKNNNLKTYTVSNYLNKINGLTKVSPISTSWETWEDDLEKKLNYPLWNNPKNKIQQALWKLAKQAIKFNEQHNTIKNDPWAQKHLDRGLSSCSWWWSSERKPDIFSPLTWHPDQIERGANELIRSIRSISSLDKQDKIKAERLFAKLLTLVWEKHWKK